MAEDGQVGGFATEAGPTVADLMDPIALEARLKDARLRRAKALAQREAGKPAAPRAHPADSRQNDVRSDRGEDCAQDRTQDRAQDRALARSAPAPTAKTVSLAPKRPGWLEELSRSKAAEPAGDADLRTPASPAETAAPAKRLRPVLLAPAASPTSRREDEPPPVAVDDDADVELLAESRVAPLVAAATARRWATPAALLFVTGLGIGATIVAMTVGSSDDEAAQVAAVTGTTGTGTEADAPTPVPSPAPAAPAVVAEAAATPEPVPAPEPPATEPAAAADRPAPVSEPAPARPGPEVDEIITAAVPTPPESVGEPVLASPEPAPAIVPGPLPKRVSIHYPRSAQADATAVQAELRAAGIADVEIMPVSLAIGRSNVRFYHDVDRAPAEGASALIADALGGAPETRDFTDYPTPTVTGRIEIWLAGEPVRTASAPREPAREPIREPAPATEVAARQSDPATPLAPGDQVREVQRILLDRMSGRP